MYINNIYCGSLLAGLLKLCCVRTGWFHRKQKGSSELFASKLAHPVPSWNTHTHINMFMQRLFPEVPVYTLKTRGMQRRETRLCNSEACVLIEGTKSAIIVRQTSTWDQLMWSMRVPHLWVTYEQNLNGVNEEYSTESKYQRLH